MSLEIIYNIEAIKVPAIDGQCFDNYLLIIQAGSSNCYECSTGRRARHWQLWAAGPQCRVMKTVCEWAGDCEGGMVKYKNGTSYCKPETLISAARKALEKADLGFEAIAQRRGIRCRLRMLMSEACSKNGSAKRFQELQKIKEPTTERRYGGEVFVFDFDQDNPAELRKWFDNLLECPSDNAEINGPRD